MAKSEGRAWAALAVASLGSASASIAKALSHDPEYERVAMMDLECARKSVADATRFLADAEAHMRLPG